MISSGNMEFASIVPENYFISIKKIPVATDSEPTIPTEQPPLGGEVSAIFCG
jgi:hypothetical protein